MRSRWVLSEWIILGVVHNIALIRLSIDGVIRQWTMLTVTSTTVRQHTAIQATRDKFLVRFLAWGLPQLSLRSLTAYLTPSWPERFFPSGIVQTMVGMVGSQPITIGSRQLLRSTIAHARTDRIEPLPLADWITPGQRLEASSQITLVVPSLFFAMVP